MNELQSEKIISSKGKPCALMSYTGRCFCFVEKGTNCKFCGQGKVCGFYKQWARRNRYYIQKKEKTFEKLGVGINERTI